MKKFFWYSFAVAVLIAIVALFEVMPHTTTFSLNYDEFFVDEYGTIHGKNCPYKEKPLFSRKYKKYDILIKSDQTICKECLLFEEDKLLLLNEINIQEEIKRLRREGASEEFINKKISSYKPK